MINAYIKFEDPAGTQVCKGGSTDKTNAGWIEVLSWSHSFSQTTSPTRSTAGSGTVERANHSPFSFTKYMESSSTELMKYNWKGDQIAKVFFEVYRADDTPVPYLKIEMDEVVVANISVSGGGGDIPIENISLNYGKVKYTYTSQSKDSGEQASNKPISHDLTTNEVA